MAANPLSATTITVGETLALLDGPFKALADGVSENRYAFWLGSGISLGRVDGLKQIIGRVLEFLRSRIDLSSDFCRFRIALDESLALAPITPEERAQIDVSQPFDAWPIADAVTARLSTNYARLLDRTVVGEPDDFLLWDAVDIRLSFADPAKEPDVEHLCIALLMLEGVATDLATANWDGLIEKAVARLTAGRRSLAVYVRSDNFQQAPLNGGLYKFHGCAVLAVADEANYRPFLIGRASQINGWVSRQEHEAMVTRLLALKEDVLSMITAHRHVIERAGYVQTEGAWHPTALVRPSSDSRCIQRAA